jgi:hypothetical protein
MVIPLNNEVMKLKLLSLVCLIILISSCIRKGGDELLRIEDRLNIYSEKLEFYKGQIIINDTVVVSGNTFQIVDIGAYQIKEKVKPLYRPKNRPYRPRLYDLDGPYTIMKEANNDTIVVIKNIDTLYFKFTSIE